MSISAIAGGQSFDGPLDVKPGVKQMFLDDYAVSSLRGIERTMHRPAKKGVVLRPDGPTDGGVRVQTYSAPIWDPQAGLFRLFYMALPYRDGQWVISEIGSAMAVSMDGLTWRRDPLNRVSFGGSTGNNRFYATDPTIQWPENSFMNVVRDPPELSSKYPYKGLVGAHSGRIPIQSINGIDWVRIGSQRIRSSDTSTLTYDEMNNRYMAFVKMPTDYGRSVAVSFSRDFATWTEPRLTFRTDDEDNRAALPRIHRQLSDPRMQKPLFVDPAPSTPWTPGRDKKEIGVIDADELGRHSERKRTGVRHIPTWRAEVYDMAVFPYEGLYLGLPSIFYPTGIALPARNNSDGFKEIQLAFNRNPELELKDWVRVGGRRAFIETSGLDQGLLGNFDRQQISACRPVVIGDRLHFYYSAAKLRGLWFEVARDGSRRDQSLLSPIERADFDDGIIGICLATLRLDGFVSLDAGAAGGGVTTKPFTATGSQLFLNVDVHASGEARVAVTDEAGKPLDGFSHSDCHELTGSDVRQKVQWRGSPWGKLQGKKVRLNISLRSADLFAFWSEK